MGYWWQQLREHPTRLPVGWFAATILAGGVLLALPLSASGARIGFLDALFTATSAVWVTGLTVRDTGSDFSTFGHVVILALIQLGGLGFSVLTDTDGNLWSRICRQRPKRLSLHSKATLATTGILLLSGTLGFWAFESGNLPRETSFPSRFLTCLFASVTPRTAGFNSIDYARATTATIFLTLVLMGIGGCPGSTAGGIKATTLAVLVATARARLRGSRYVSLFGRGISQMAVDKSLAIVSLVTVLVVGGALLLAAVELRSLPHVQTPERSVGLLFEVVSALGTVGLTTGITPTLTAGGKVVVIVLLVILLQASLGRRWERWVGRSVLASPCSRSGKQAKKARPRRRLPIARSPSPMF